MSVGTVIVAILEGPSGTGIAIVPSWTCAGAELGACCRVLVGAPISSSSPSSRSHSPLSCPAILSGSARLASANVGARENPRDCGSGVNGLMRGEWMGPGASLYNLVHGVRSPDSPPAHYTTVHTVLTLCVKWDTVLGWQEVLMPKVMAETLLCNRCGHLWRPHKDNPNPLKCANPDCRSVYWDRERRQPKVTA